MFNVCLHSFTHCIDDSRNLLSGKGDPTKCQRDSHNYQRPVFQNYDQTVSIMIESSLSNYRSIGMYGKGPSKNKAAAPARVLATMQTLTETPLRSQKYPQIGLATLFAPSFSPKNIPTYNGVRSN